MALRVLVALVACVTVSALTARQPLLSRESDSWGDEVVSQSSQTPLATETDPYESSFAEQAVAASAPDSEKYSRPFNLKNGACDANEGGRYVMEIENVDQGNYYIGKISFGTPPQELNMLLDTGSDEIVVKGKGCLGCLGRGFSAENSSTYVKFAPEEDPDHGKQETVYGSGAVIAQRGSDTVHTGHLFGNDMPIQIVEETNIPEFADDSAQALEVIAGMAPGLPEYTGDKLASRMQVRHFSECLPYNNEENGFFVVNDDHPQTNGFNGPFTSMGNYYWAVGVANMRFEWKDGSHKTWPLAQKSFSALADTGTTLLSVPQIVLNNIEDALRELDYDCSRMEELPDLTFDIDGVTHKIPAASYVVEVDGWSYYAKNASKMAKSEMASKRENYYFKNTEFKNKQTGAQCELLFTDPIQLDSTLGEIGILGMPFFRNYIISFDFCSRTMWTKPSTGDCSRAVGATPSNKQVCKDDGMSVGCMWNTVSSWVKSTVIDGLASIFTENKPPKAGPRLKVKPGSERLSHVAKWLLKGDKQTVVEI